MEFDLNIGTTSYLNRLVNIIYIIIIFTINKPYPRDNDITQLE